MSLRIKLAIVKQKPSAEAALEVLHFFAYGKVQRRQARLRIARHG